jgi:hypothetical protein
VVQSLYLLNYTGNIIEIKKLKESDCRVVSSDRIYTNCYEAMKFVRAIGGSEVKTSDLFLREDFDAFHVLLSLKSYSVH